MPATDVVLIYATFPTLDAARDIGGDLVQAGLAACVNIGQPMTAIYLWEGRRHEDAEVPMLIKTRAACAEAVVAAVRSGHSYDNPAVLVLPVVAGSAPFLAWIAAQTVGSPAGDG